MSFPQRVCGKAIGFASSSYLPLRLRTQARPFCTATRAAGVNASTNAPRASAATAPHDVDERGQDARVSVGTSESEDEEKEVEGNVYPGVMDAQNGFAAGPSVAFWKTFDPSKSGVMERLLRDLRSDVLEKPTALAYYGYCFGRSLFFSTIGLLGLQSRNFLKAYSEGSKPTKFDFTIAPRQFAEAGYAFRDDWMRIQNDAFKLPWDVNVRHKQANPAYIARNAALFFRNANETLEKRASENPDIGIWLDSVAFPDYYKQTYHFQTDGWVSSRSADVYEVSTETLFIGRQDAMQRLALVGIGEQAKSMGPAAEPKIVEIGAGTGRVATFALDNYPTADYVLSDLSPFYLRKARENVEYWKSFRGSAADGAKVRYLQAAAEALPLEDASADVVLSVYLFHELPREARRDVSREAARVLKPGGSLVMVDSIQLGDRDSRDPHLDNFENFNEPWYPSYIREDFGKLFEDVGLVPHRKEISSASKMLTFRKTS